MSAIWDALRSTKDKEKRAEKKKRHRSYSETTSPLISSSPSLASAEHFTLAADLEKQDLMDINLESVNFKHRQSMNVNQRVYWNEATAQKNMPVVQDRPTIRSGRSSRAPSAHTSGDEQNNFSTAPPSFLTAASDKKSFTLDNVYFNIIHEITTANRETIDSINESHTAALKTMAIDVQLLGHRMNLMMFALDQVSHKRAIIVDRNGNYVGPEKHPAEAIEASSGCFCCCLPMFGPD